MEEKSDLFYALQDVKKNLNKLTSERDIEQQIMGILYKLKWNCFDPNTLKTQFPVRNGRVDFALLHNGKPLVFIEAKKQDYDIDAIEYHNQTIRYAFEGTAEIVILTNGDSWHFYLPREIPDWRERRFLKFFISSSSLEELEKFFVDYLSFENITNGKAFEKAKQELQRILRNKDINDLLPKILTDVFINFDENIIKKIIELFEEKHDLIITPDEIIENIKKLSIKIDRIGNNGFNGISDGIIKPNPDGEKEYIIRYRKQLKTPNTLISKIKHYIDNKGEILQGELKKVCVNEFGCINESSGSINASIRVLILDGYIKATGMGREKRLVSNHK